MTTTNTRPAGIREREQAIRGLVDGLRCANCGRVPASDEDWKTYDEGEGDHLCWGMGANCEAEYEGAPRFDAPTMGWLLARLDEAEEALREAAQDLETGRATRALTAELLYALGAWFIEADPDVPKELEAKVVELRDAFVAVVSGGVPADGNEDGLSGSPTGSVSKHGSLKEETHDD